MVKAEEFAAQFVSIRTWQKYSMGPWKSAKVRLGRGYCFSIVRRSKLGQIHGHEVMQMIMGSDKKFTKESLKREIVDTFGEGSRFFSCSDADMTADQIIDFFERMGKLRFTEDGLTMDTSGGCGH